MTALSGDVFSALQVPKVAGIKCICWLLSNKSLLLCIPLELFMYRVPWYIAMWLGSVERRRPLNHTFKIKVIWEQNHVSGDSFSFLCQWLTTFPFLNARKWGVPLAFIVTFCLALLPSVQSRHPRARQAALGTQRTFLWTSLAGKTKLWRNGGDRERVEERLRIGISKNAELHAKWGFLTFHVPLQDSVFRSLWGCSHWCWKQIRYLCYSTWLWKWAQWINGVILDKSVSWLLVLSTVNVRWFTLCVEQGQGNAMRRNNCFPSDEPSFALQPLDQKRSSDIGSICTAAITSVLGIKVAEILGPYKSPPRSRSYSVLALYFLRCVSSKTGRCKPGQTEVFCSNYCFKRVSCSPAVFWLMQEMILSQWFVSVGLTASVRANSAPRLLWWR